MPTRLTATYRTPRGFECAVDIDDLSLGGCRMDDLRGGLMLGEYVEIAMAGAGPFVAEVARRQALRVELQFNRPLSAQVVSELTGVEVKASGPPPQPIAPSGGSTLCGGPVSYFTVDAKHHTPAKGRGIMSMPFWAGVFGLIVSLVFGFNAIRELRRNQEGHARNAAMIHIAMVSMFLPASLIIMAFYGL
ncbi:MAG: hypothetical protein AAFY19_06415 [Pseudomonadota bacterium]